MLNINIHIKFNLFENTRYALHNGVSILRDVEIDPIVNKIIYFIPLFSK